MEIAKRVGFTYFSYWNRIIVILVRLKITIVILVGGVATRDTIRPRINLDFTKTV